MKQVLFAIRDTKLEAFAPPFVSANNNTAMRSFQEVATDQQTTIYKHPSDYSLIRIGTWDEDEGKIEQEDHTTLAWASDFHNEQIT